MSTDHWDKQYRLVEWQRRQREGAICTFCGTVQWRCLNTLPDGSKACGQCMPRLLDAKEKAEPHCPECGSAALVLITPRIPGPDGWARRCTACGHRWDLADEPLPSADATGQRDAR